MPCWLVSSLVFVASFGFCGAIVSTECDDALSLLAIKAPCQLSPDNQTNLSLGLVNASFGAQLLQEGFLSVGTDYADSVAEEVARSLNGAVRAIGLKLTECSNTVSFIADHDSPLGDMHLTKGSASALRPKTNSLDGAWQLSLVGGVCGGKTSSLKAISEALDQNGTKTFAVPEVSTEILKLIPQWSIWDCAVAHQELQVQAMLVQLSWQYSWASLARKQTPLGLDTVDLTDRDIFNQKIYTKPLYGYGTWTWTELFKDFKQRLGDPLLRETDLVQTYPLGAIFLQSLAIKNGTLNKDEYNAVCTENNPERGQTAEEAMEDDQRALTVYESTYPASKLCVILNDGPRAAADGFQVKVQDAVDCAIMHLQDVRSLQSQ